MDKEDNKGKKSHKGRWIGLAVAIIIIVGIIYLYETYGTIPSTLISTLSTGKQLNSSTLESVMFQKIATSNTFAVNYTGQITIKKDPAISFSFAKYYNSTKITFSVADSPIFQNASGVFVSKNVSSNGLMSPYGTLCFKASPGSVLNLINGSNVTNGYRCVQTSDPEVQAQAERITNAFVNISSLNNAAPKSYGVKLYNGQPCYYVAGNGTIYVNSSLVDINTGIQTPVNINFNACFSAQYGIPVTVWANMSASNGSSITISLNESSINQNTTSDQVNSLP